MKRIALLSLALTACGIFPTVPAPPPPEPTLVAPAAAYPKARPIPVPPAIQLVVDAPDRSPADRALDKGRHPGEMLAFLGIRPGMRVADLAAGGGYTTELLARAVGPSGKVWGQNPRFLVKRYVDKPWSERLAQPVMKNVVRVDRELDDPLPPEATGLDAVVMILFYHDTFWLKAGQDECTPDCKPVDSARAPVERARATPKGVDAPATGRDAAMDPVCQAACKPLDRAAMNRAVYRALRPGGIYAIVDHSARPGARATEVASLHRVEEKAVRDEIEAAGFRLVESGDFLRNPADARDWNDAPGAAGERRGTSDRFALKFVKP